MSEEYSLAQLLNEQEFRKCFPDWNESSDAEKLEAFTYFCRTYWWIMHPDPNKGRLLFELSAAQTEAAECWLTERFSIVLKARQIGFSTLVAAFAFWFAYGYQDRHVTILSKGKREAVELLQKAKYGYSSLPAWMKHHGPVVPRGTQEKMVFGTSSITSVPSGKNPARGLSTSLAILDEMAFLEHPNEAWAAVKPIADVGGRIIVLSTANGEGNIFHDLWTKSKGGGNGTSQFRGLFFPWWQAAGIDRDQDWYEAEAATTPDWLMAQEYPDDPEDAFLRSGHPVFNLQIIRRWEPVPAIAEGYLWKPENQIVLHEGGGPLSIWEMPTAKSKYVIGADVAEGHEHGDYSSAHVLNARTRVIAAHWHGHIDTDLFGEDVLYLLGMFYNKALIGIERNKAGAAIKSLQRMRYPVIFRQRSEQLRAPTPTETMGWYTTPQNKAMMMDDLVRAFRGDGDGVNGLVCPDVETTQELKTFVREGSGKMHGSPHDDRVMSLAIAVQMLRYAFYPEYTVKEEPGPGTWGWFDRMAFKKKRVGNFIGQHSYTKAA